MGVDRGNERRVRGAREPQGSDLRVLEHGSDYLGTVDADVVVVETARGDVDLRKQVCQWALTEGMRGVCAWRPRTSRQ